MSGQDTMYQQSNIPLKNKKGRCYYSSQVHSAFRFISPLPKLFSASLIISCLFSVHLLLSSAVSISFPFPLLQACYHSNQSILGCPSSSLLSSPLLSSLIYSSPPTFHITLPHLTSHLNFSNVILSCLIYNLLSIDACNFFSYFHIKFHPYLFSGSQWTNLNLIHFVTLLGIMPNSKIN